MMLIVDATGNMSLIADHRGSSRSVTLLPLYRLTLALAYSIVSASMIAVSNISLKTRNCPLLPKYRNSVNTDVIAFLI